MRFKLSKWDEAFTAHRALDGVGAIADARLHRTGQWFWERLERLRAELRTTQASATDPEDFALVIVGYLNAVTVGARNIEPTMITVDIPSAGDDTVAPPFAALDASTEGLLSRLHDIARFPLRDALRARTTPDGGAATVPRRDLLAVLRAVMPLATRYEMLEDLWGECVWNGWYVDESGENDIVIPADVEREEQRAMSNLRDAHIRAELAARSRFDATAMGRMVRARIRQQPHVIGIERAGRQRRLIVGPAQTSLSEPTPTEQIELTAEVIYLAPLLDQPLELLSGLTVREITHGWRLIASLGHHLVNNHLPPRSSREVTATGTALTYAPTFARDELLGCLRRDAGFDAEQANTILDLLTFSSAADSDLWLAPLVPVADGQLAPVLASLAWPNLLRLQEHWLFRGGIDLALRGGEFEQHVREHLNDCCRLPNASVIRRAVTLKGPFADEEVDLMIRIGDTVILGEIKCTLSLAVTVEFGRMFSLLDGAAAQIERKVIAASEDLEELRRATGWADLSASAKLVPVVVSNLQFAAGHAFREIPVVDLFLLARYLDDGRVQHFVDFMKGTKGLVESRFYDSPEQAADRVAHYLRYPPQVTSLRQYVIQVVNQLPAPGTPKAALYAHWETMAPTTLAIPAGAVAVVAPTTS